MSERAPNRLCLAVLRRLTFAAAVLGLGGCYHAAQQLSGSLDAGLITRQSDAGGNASYTVPATPLLPDARLRLTPNFGLSLENMLIGAAIYYFVDPLAPNWSGEMKRLSEDTYGIALRSKRLRASGGDGEAGRVFRRNAERIVREGGYEGYRILDYSEGIESELIGAYRYAEGTIRIVRR